MKIIRSIIVAVLFISAVCASTANAAENTSEAILTQQGAAASQMAGETSLDQGRKRRVSLRPC